LDKAAIEQSLRKTRRLVVVQEDTENCSVGQMIISHVTSTSELWNEMISPPVLVSKANVMIGYNPIYEYAALPDVDRIVSAIRRSIATKHERIAVVPTSRDDSRRAAPEPEFPEPGSTIPATADAGKRQVQSITVPVMGEGIRNAKVVSLLKKPGDPIELDDELCEVETDKAVYPSNHPLPSDGEWKTKVGDTVEIGQELGSLIAREPAFADQFETAAKKSADREPVEAAVSAAESVDRGRHARHYNIEPALSPTITRKLSRVISANLQIDARWDAIREAREAAKRRILRGPLPFCNGRVVGGACHGKTCAIPPANSRRRSDRAE